MSRSISSSADSVSEDNVGPDNARSDDTRPDHTRSDNARSFVRSADGALPGRFGLSKTKIAAFEQCRRRLWLSVHRPDLAARTADVEAFLRTGHEIGELACRAHPDGVMVLAEPNLAAALATTRELLATGPVGAIFEATLEHDGVLVRIDILEPDGTGGWRLAEVKTTTRVKDYHRGDIATQLWVARNAGVPISSAAVRHIDPRFVLEAQGVYDGLFRDTEMLADVEALVAGRATVVEAARSTLAGTEPDIDPGPHCDTPFSCEFAAHCHSSLPSPPEWPVTILPYGGGTKWLAEGIDDLLALDPSRLASDLHRRIHAATVSGEPYHNVEAFRAGVATWPFPRTWLDFETIAFAIPRWIGTRPFEQVPFQFCAQIEREDATIEEVEFLSRDGEDPRAACTRTLIDRLPTTGAIVAYNASFEKNRILDLARFCSKLSGELESLAARIVDLLPLTRANWYHPDQRGSCSIKAVLPTVAPKLDYDDLAVKDGQAAQLAYLEAIAAGTSETRRSEIDAALRAYCRRDTEAMMVLAKRLTGEG